MTFVSYAQNFEDVMLWRAFKDVDNGFYIDVGANDPVIDSVTHAFYERGWSGINIEPVPLCFKKLQQKRPRDINLQIVAGVVSGEVAFYEVIDTGLSTISEATAKRHKAERNLDYIKRTIPSKTLTEVCNEFDITEINFLKIDVEGAEKQVLEGLHLLTIRPWIVLVEATLPMLQTTSHENWEWILLEANYNFVYFDGINRFYISKEQEKLSKHFSSPPNVFDAFQVHRHVAAEVKCERLSKQFEEKTNEFASSQSDNAQLRNEIQTIYRSKSWRLTWPLRKSMQLVKWLFSLSVSLSHWVFRLLKRMARDLLVLPKRIARGLLVKSMARVLKHPRLKIWVRVQLRNHPGFEVKLRRLALARGLLNTQASNAKIHIQSVTKLPKSDESTTVAPDLSRLSFNARQIYVKIQTKKAHYKRTRL